MTIQLWASLKIDPHSLSSSSKSKPQNHRKNVSDKSLNAVLGPTPRYYKSLGLDLKPLKNIL
jgi:hypothetical protein